MSIRSKPSVADDVLVRVLGPVRLEVDGRPVRLGAHLRVLLAVLLTARGHPVSRIRLAEMLWGEPTPASAGATLRSHVAHLRQAIEPGRPARQPSRIVVTEDHGYALCLAPDQLDSSRFERLLGQGRQALDANDPGAAARLLAEALAMWYGEPLADVADGAFALAEVARLRALRSTALRWRIDADLASGRHEVVLGELRSLVADDPADERLRCQLALALYRCGQCDAAVEVCADGLRLARGRGLDAPALRTMQTDVLRRSAALGWARQRPPIQIPADAADFTGRAAELAALADRLARCSDGPVAVAVDGKPGIGKSALAVHLAHRLARDFPDGVLYANLRGAERHRLAPIDVVGRFLRTLGVPDQQVPPTLDAASSALRSVLASRRVLIVLDNAADAAQVRPLLPAGAGNAVIITSRRPMAELDAVASQTLDLLEVDDAVTLLGRLAGPQRVAADPGSARAVVRYCGLLPLAVRIAGARLRTRPSWSVATLAARLADERQRLAELAVGDLAVQSSFQLSYQDLIPSDRRLFQLLGLLDSADLSVDAAAAVVDTPVAEVERAMERLVDAQLLETHAPGRYRFHDLLRLFAKRCAEAHEDAAARQAAVSRGLRWYLRRAEHAHGILLPTSRRGPGESPRDADEHAALTWLDLERANLVSAVRQAAEAAPDPVCSVAWRLNDQLARYFVIRRFWSHWTVTSQAALAAARTVDDLAAQGVAHRHLGTIFSQQFRFPEAEQHLRRALLVFRQSGHRCEEGQVLDKLGVLHGMRRQPAEAIDYCSAALAVARGIGDRRLESKALNNLGFAHCEQGRPEKAAKFVQRSVAILREIGERFELSTTLDSLGDIYLKQGRYTDALSCFRECMSIARSYDDRFDEAMALRGIGLVTRELRGTAASRRYLRQALAILVELRAPQAEDVRQLLKVSSG